MTLDQIRREFLSPKDYDLHVPGPLKLPKVEDHIEKAIQASSLWGSDDLIRVEGDPSVMEYEMINRNKEPFCVTYMNHERSHIDNESFPKLIDGEFTGFQIFLHPDSFYNTRGLWRVHPKHRNKGHVKELLRLTEVIASYFYISTIRISKPSDIFNNHGYTIQYLPEWYAEKRIM